MIPTKENIHFPDVAGVLVPNAEVIVEKHTDFDMTDMHTHDFIEIAFVLSGHGWHVMSEDIMRCGPGSIYVINCEDAHMFMCEYNTPLTIYNLIFRPGFFDLSLLGKQSFADVINHFLLRTFQYDGFSHSLAAHFSADEISGIARLFDNMLHEYTQHEPGFEELIRAWTIELLVYIFRKLRAEEDLSTALPQIKTDVFNGVFEYIQQNYNEPISLEKLSMLAFLSPKYFSRLFKTYTGCTVTEYTQKLRISHACEMLSGSAKDTIAEIATHTGYSDVKYFTKIFRRLMGISPTEYRRRAHSEAESVD